MSNIISFSLALRKTTNQIALGLEDKLAFKKGKDYSTLIFFIGVLYFPYVTLLLTIALLLVNINRCQ